MNTDARFLKKDRNKIMKTITNVSVMKRFKLLAVIAGGLICGLAFATPVSATSVSGTMTAQYFEVLNGTGGPDFGGLGTPILTLGSGLGPNGLPIATGGVSEIDPVTHELTWWSPALNSAVLATGSGTVALPFSSNMFPPNSTGTNDSSAFETAILSGTFNLAAPGTVHFTVGSDDDSFVYVNGILVGQNPGIHPVTDVTFTANGLAGSNSIEVFYADREQVGAFLDVSADVSVSAVPEASTWALLLLGLSTTLGLRPLLRLLAGGH